MLDPGNQITIRGTCMHACTSAVASSHALNSITHILILSPANIHVDVYTYCVAWEIQLEFERFVTIFFKPMHACMRYWTS